MSIGKLHTVLTYGTLRPFTNEDVVLVPGHLYDLGWYPGIKLMEASETESRVVCERITVTTEKLNHLDQYEGCAHGYDPINSLYTRQKVGKDWIYVYNNYGAEDPFQGKKLIESGDWQLYEESRRQVA